MNFPVVRNKFLIRFLTNFVFSNVLFSNLDNWKVTPWNIIRYYTVTKGYIIANFDI